MLLRRARPGDDLSRAVTEVWFRAAGGGLRFVCQAADDAEPCCHTPGAVFENTEAARNHRGNQREQVKRERFSPAKRRMKACAPRRRDPGNAGAGSSGVWIHPITRSIIGPHIDHLA